MNRSRLFYLMFSLIVLVTVSSCASSAKGFDYHSNDKRNKHYGRYQKHRYKKTKGDLTKTKCANRRFHPN